MESIAWLVAVLALLQVYHAGIISTKKNYHPYYMQDQCGKILYIGQTAVADVYLARKFGYEPRSCNFTVKSGVKHHQIQAQIIQVDTNHREFTSCQTSDNLQLYSVNQDRNRLLTGDGICGAEVIAPDQMIESDQTTILLAFTSQGKTDVPHRGFHLRFTAFHPEECQPDEFSCGNYKCIKRFLTCDDVNNCGDNTDEARDMAGCKLGRRHRKRDVNSHDVITEKEINDYIRAHPELSMASVMDSNNKTYPNDQGATAPKLTNTLLMIVGVTVGSVLIIISVVACIVNRRLKTDRVDDIARSSFTWSQTNAPTLESQTFGY